MTVDADNLDLRASETETDVSLTAMPDSNEYLENIPLWKYDLDARTIEFSSYAARTFGLDPHQTTFSRTSVIRHIVEADRRYLLGRWMRHQCGLADRLEATVRVNLGDGDVNSLEVRGKIDPTGRTVYGTAWSLRLTAVNESHLVEQVTQLNSELAALQTRQFELEQTNEWLKKLATRDGLTSLHNHRSLQERLTIEAAKSERTHTPFSLVMMDVDRFKSFNDEHGHPAGDALLTEISNHLTSSVRISDLVARYGGDEFAILLPDTALAEAEQLAERVRVRIASSDFWGTSISASFGCAEYIPGMMSKADLIHDADRSLYRAKRAGRNCVRIAELRSGNF